MSEFISQEEAVERIKVAPLDTLREIVYREDTISALREILDSTTRFVWTRYEKSGLGGIGFSHPVYKYRHIPVDDKGVNTAHSFYFHLMRDTASMFLDLFGEKIYVTGSLCSGYATFPVTKHLHRELASWNIYNFKPSSDIDVRLNDQAWQYKSFILERMLCLGEALPEDISLAYADKPDVSMIPDYLYSDYAEEPLLPVTPLDQSFPASILFRTFQKDFSYLDW
jgi:hypothetical protein